MQHKILEVCDISIQFGGTVALDGVSFDMNPGTVLGLIGPNGAGKTTLFNCLSRFCSPDSGDIVFQGKSILQRPAHRIVDAGIGRTFQLAGRDRQRGEAERWRLTALTRRYSGNRRTRKIAPLYDDRSD